MQTARRAQRDRIDRLRQVALFADCTTEELARVDRIGTRIDVPAGRVLTREGSHADQCFVTLTGLASAARAGRRIGTIGAGSVAGEMALLDDTPRNATIVTETPMQVLVLTRREFAALRTVSPAVEAAIGRIAATRRAEAGR
jgi:CRP/FNR family cyclic AMP-dependent transcriptional regulator